MDLRESLPPQSYWWEKEPPPDNVYSLHYVVYFFKDLYMCDLIWSSWASCVDCKIGPDFPALYVSMPFTKSYSHQEVKCISLGSGLASWIALTSRTCASYRSSKDLAASALSAWALWLLVNKSKPVPWRTRDPRYTAESADSSQSRCLTCEQA